MKKNIPLLLLLISVLVLIYSCTESTLNKPDDERDEFPVINVNAITEGGFDVLFRLGPSWNDPVYEYNNDPPGTIRDNQENITHIADHDDSLKFATICKNIVRHYNEGWAGGYFLNIKRWEIWNEPSLASQFWSGTAGQFYDMFSAVFFSLKGYDNTLKVGGPGLAGHSTDEYETGLLEYCMNNNLGIDYFSWHNYGNEGGGGDNAVQSPDILGSRADFVRGKMNDFGFGSAGSICSEWNADLGDRNFTDSGKGAAFFGGALTLMEIKGIEESYLYRGDDHPLGIFKNLTELKTGAYVLKAWKILSSDNIGISEAFPGYSGQVHTHFYGEPLTDRRIFDLIKITREILPGSEIVIFTNGELLSKKKYNLFKEHSVDRFVVTQHTNSTPRLMRSWYDRNKFKDVRLQIASEDIPLYNRGGAVELDKPAKLKFCHYAPYAMIFNTEGDVVSCCNDPFSSTIFGNFSEGIGNLWNKQEYKTFRKQARRGEMPLKICRSCTNTNPEI